ncbi:hypothetical protein FS749_016507 [Ceratobasidium sp. UAMH 11750]|nr:hypothetical protein FS749_016507 [Ceratobasidium sp. UAMH 11750]
MLSTINTELSALEEEEERIQKARRVLVDACNRVKMTSPVYSLPPEILTRIFLDAACHYAHDESKPPTCVPSSPVTLSAVCKQWRTIATNSRSLWAHLDILIDGTNRWPRYPSSQLWIGCLQETPLHVHIRQHSSTPRRCPDIHDLPIHPDDMSDSDDPDDSDDLDSSGDSDNSDNSSTSDDLDDSNDSDGSAATQSHTPRISLSSLTGFLIPLMSHVNSLELISSIDFQPLLYSMLERLINSDDEHIPMRTVRIIHDERCDPLQFRMSRSPTGHYSEDYKAFFSSLVTLDLRNVYPLWDYLTLTNLVELRFEAISLMEWFCITLAELAATLSSCPKLRSLMLLGLRVTPAPGETRPRPVALDDLRVLSLRYMAWEGDIERTISIIHPGPHPLHLSIHLPEEHEPSSINKFLTELCSFFRQSNVTIFYAESIIFNMWFASQLGPLPNVHTLVLRACQISDVTGTPSTRRRNPCPINPSIVLWPRLRNLYLIRCGLDKHHLRRLLSLHTIQKLHLHWCYDDALPDVDVFLTPRFLEKCRLLLSDLTPSIEMVVNDTHEETEDWLFVGTRLP